MLAVAYGARGEIVSFRNGDGVTSRLTYDGRQRLIGERLDGMGRSIELTYKYDAAGRVVGRLSPTLDWGRAAYAYDGATGRLATRAVGSGGRDLVTTFTYDDRGRPTRITTVAVPACASGDCVDDRYANEVSYDYVCR